MTQATTIGGGTQAGGFPVVARRRCASRACTGSAPGLKAAELLDLAKLSLDFVAMEFTTALIAAWKEPGPHLIDAVIPPLI